MDDLSQKRCYNHSHREAAAMCLACGRTFCRECVTEHKGRVLCSACLGEITGDRKKRRFPLAGAVALIELLTGVIIGSLGFYWIARALVALPASYHADTLWKGFLP